MTITWFGNIYRYIMIASAYELEDFGCWSAILESTVYTGLFQVGKAVLDGVFETVFRGRKRITKKAEETIACLQKQPYPFHNQNHWYCP